MRRQMVKAIDMKTGEETQVVRLIPESPEDEAELQRMARAGEIDVRSLSDGPDATGPTDE